MVTIRVCRKGTGKSVENKKVFISFSSVMRGWAEEWTDSGGDANFNVDPGNGKVVIDGSTLMTGHLSGRIVVYI